MEGGAFRNSEGKAPDRRKFYNCSKCRYRTDRKNNLKRHLTTMHENCSKLLECCNLIFLNKSALKEHVNEFHAGAGYACLVCNRKFSRKALMKRHSTVHNGRRDFNCQGCDYSTSHKSNLDRHVKRHRPIAESTAQTFDYLLAFCNNFLSARPFYEDENEASFERIRYFNELLSRDPWYHSGTFYHHILHSNLEYAKQFYRHHNLESKLVVFKEGPDFRFPLEESRRNFLFHLHGSSWNSCQFCQQYSHTFYYSYENKEIQRQFFHAWMDTMRSFNAKQLVWKDKADDDVEMWSKQFSDEKEAIFSKDSKTSSLFGAAGDKHGGEAPCLLSSRE